MPELPEVEVVARNLHDGLSGRSILSAESSWPGQIETPEYPEFRRRIRGTTIVSIWRRGKFIVFELSGEDTMFVHLRMTGQLAIQNASDPIDAHVHTIFQLDDGSELRFRDTRKFGRIYLVPDPETIIGKLGPEPLDNRWNERSFRELLSSRRRIIKPFLMDQANIAGIGNIYADEALHVARIRPQRTTNSLSKKESNALFGAIRSVLLRAIQYGGATIMDYRRPDGSQGQMQEEFLVYGRENEPCFNCGLPISRVVLGGRSTYYCDRCQK